jgi:hypothetical protein
MVVACAGMHSAMTAASTAIDELMNYFAGVRGAITAADTVGDAAEAQGAKGKAEAFRP